MNPPAAAQADSSSGSDLFNVGWASQDANTANSVAWGDSDGDGSLDLAVGQFKTE